MRTTRLQIVLAVAMTIAIGIALPFAQTRAGGAATAPAAGAVSSPKQEWGHNVGDDYFLANYKQLDAYWHKLEKESNRIHIQEIGKSTEGRPQLMAIITAPENYAKLDRYKSISRQLSLNEKPDGSPLSDAEAQALAKEGKAVIWIDGGLHATEVLGAQQLLEMVYQMVSLNDDETQRFLRDVILLCVPANPDGMDLVSDQYMKFGSMNPPVLYNHYAGHDDNRDSYMNALPETVNVSRVMYREWFPQIMYNHHQTGPNGAVMFAPPFRDPFNYNFHPYIPAAMDIIGANIATRAIVEGKPGVVNRKAQNYSTWWNGGFRTAAYFHNQLGILTETIGNPTPMQNAPPFTTRFAVGDMNNWFPITPGNWPNKTDNAWHFRTSIEYSITANRATLDYAARNHEELLYRIYQMGRDEIKWGNEDHWTFTPHKTAKVEMAVCGSSSVPTVATPGGAAARGGAGGRGARGGAAGAGAAGAGAAGAGAAGAGAAGAGAGGDVAAAAAAQGFGGGGGRGGGGNGCPQLFAALTTKELRDPRGFIMPSDQPDFGTAVRFVNALMKSGVTVHRATRAFAVAGKNYPANSLIVKTAQPFRPHVMDMFEPQDHPDDIPYPGATPTAPYDNAGYTLAFQMGVQFDRMLDAFDGPFEKVTTEFVKVPAGVIKAPAPAPGADAFNSANFPNATESDFASARALYAKLATRDASQAPRVVGYFFSHQPNDSFVVINRLLAAGEDVSWLANGPMGPGTFYVAAKPTTRPLLEKAATDLGISFQSTTTAPVGAASKLRKPKIGLVDSPSGSMPVGWTRLVFKNFDFPFVEDSENDVFPPVINAGSLNSAYDVLIFNGVGLGGAGGGRGGRGGGGGANAGDEPPAGAAAAGAGAAGAAGAGATGAAAAGRGGDAGAAGAAAAGAAGARGGGNAGRGGGAGGRGGGVRAPGDDRPAPLPMPEKYAKRQGSIDTAGQAALKLFVENGGTIIAIGSASSSAIQLFNLPLTAHVTASRTDYYVPGSVLTVAVDTKNPLAHGYGDKVDIFFDNNPVWKLTGTPANVRPVAWFPNAEPLKSGWAWGQSLLDKGIEIVEAQVGKGRVILFGNELLFRSQPHGNYKFFFNAIYLSVAPDMK